MYRAMYLQAVRSKTVHLKNNTNSPILARKRTAVIARVSYSVLKLLQCFRSLEKFNLRFYAVNSRIMSSMQARMRTRDKGTTWQLPLRCLNFRSTIFNHVRG